MRLLLSFLTLCFIVFISGSCSIQKRQHRSGWHVSWNQRYDSSEKERQEQEFKSASAQVKKIDEKITFTGKKKNTNHIEIDTIYDLPNEANTEKKKQSPKKFKTTLNNVAESIFTSPKKVRRQQKKKQGNLLLSRLEPDEEKSGHWFPRFLGGFFGVLVGLIAFIPLFFVVCLFFVTEGKVSDLTFQENENDGPMTRSFKKSYHAVFRVGLLLMIIALIFGAAALLIFIAYATLEIVGLILGILLTLLILFLFIKIWRGLLDFLMFE